MNIKKLIVGSGMMVVCIFGFVVNTQASSGNSGKFLNRKTQVLIEKANCMSRNTVNTEEVVIDETYSYPCAYGHENCDGIHANEDCVYHENCDGQHINGNQDGTGMGYHHNEGTGYQNNGNYGHHRGNHHN